MDSVLAFLTPFISLFVTVILIICGFVFVIKPILNYFVLNREIENRKKLAREYQEAKRQAEANRTWDSDDENSWAAGGNDPTSDDLVEQANKTIEKKNN